MATAATGERAAEIGARYPRKVALRGDRSIELRLMEAGDRDRMLAFAQGLPADDLLFLRSNITEPAAVEGWIANIADGRTVTVLGTDGEAVGGYASLHLNQAEWMRHVGEIRLLTGSGFRGAGLGRVLASEIYAVAGILGLSKLSAQMTLDQPGARATFERLGFKPEALLTDWVMSADGRTRDLLVMAYDVKGLTDTV
ncbi:MAG: GNAT family N-acetyltransferase [Tepidiformaceae bacterium]